MSFNNDVSVQVDIKVSDYSLIMSDVQKLQDRLNALSAKQYDINIKLDNSISEWAKSVQKNIDSVEKSLRSISDVMPKRSNAFDSMSDSLVSVGKQSRQMYETLTRLTAEFISNAKEAQTALKNIFEAIPEESNLSSKAIRGIGQDIQDMMAKIDNLFDVFMTRIESMVQAFGNVGKSIESLTGNTQNQSEQLAKSMDRLRSSFNSSQKNTKGDIAESLINEEGLAKLQAYVTEVISTYQKLVQFVGETYRDDKDFSQSISKYFAHAYETGKTARYFGDLMSNVSNVADGRAINLPTIADDPKELLSTANDYIKFIKTLGEMRYNDRLDSPKAGQYLINQEDLKGELDALAQYKKEYTDFIKSIKSGQEGLKTTTEQQTQGTTQQNVVLDTQQLLSNIVTQLDEIRTKLQETFDFSKLNIDATPVTSVLDQIKNTVTEIQTTLGNLAPALGEVKKATSSGSDSVTGGGNDGKSDLSSIIDYSVDVDAKMSKMAMSVRMTEDAMSSLKTSLSGENFSNAAITQITGNLEKLDLVIKSITADASGDKLKITIDGTDKLGTTISKVLEFDRATGELVNTKDRIRQVFETADNSIDTVTQQMTKRWETVQDALKEDTFTTTIEGLQRRLEALGNSSNESIPKIEEDLKSLIKLEGEMRTGTDKTDVAKKYDEWSETLTRVKNNLKNVEDQEKKTNQQALNVIRSDTLSEKMSQWLEADANRIAKYGEKIARLQEMLRTGGGSSAVKSLVSAEFGKIQQEANGATGSVQNLFDAIKNGTTLGKVALSGMAMALRNVRRVVREAIKSAMEIESSLAQLQVITGSSGGELDVFFSEGAKAAKEYGTEVSDMLDSVTTFSRLGYNLQESLDFSRVATELSNVADVDVNAGTSGLTSILKAYQDEGITADHIADVLTVVGQKYAISASELMTAFERGGAALSATGTSFEKSAALFAAANAALQNPESVGTAMKTVSARIRGAKTELEDLGEEYEDVAEGFSKYRDELKALTNVDGTGGFDIMADEATNSYKDIYEIFVGISGVWDQLSDTTQARVAEILGGTRQLSVISSLITNIADAEGAYEDAMNSAGIAAEANNIVMDTTEKKVEQLKTSFQVLARDVLSSDLTKGIVDFGTKAIDVIDSLVNAVGALPVALGAIAGLDIIKNLGKLYCPPREQFLAA